MSRPSMKARPTIYMGIKMRSRLEAYVAQRFDAAGRRWTYEPCAYGSPEGQYLPDFRLDPDCISHCSECRPRCDLGRTSYTYVEVKPDLPTGKGLTYLRDRMLIIRASDPEAHLVIWDPTGNLAYLTGLGEDVDEWFHQGPWI